MPHSNFTRCVILPSHCVLVCLSMSHYLSQWRSNALSSRHLIMLGLQLSLQPLLLSCRPRSTVHCFLQQHVSPQPAAQQRHIPLHAPWPQQSPVHLAAAPAPPNPKPTQLPSVCSRSCAWSLYRSNSLSARSLSCCVHNINKSPATTTTAAAWSIGHRQVLYLRACLVVVAASLQKSLIPRGLVSVYSPS